MSYWNTAFTIVRHLLVSTFLVVSIGTVVYIGKTFTKKLEPTINYVNSSCTFVKDAVEQTLGTEEQRKEIQKDLQKASKNAAELTEQANKILNSLNDILNSDKELSKEEREQLGNDIRETFKNTKEITRKINQALDNKDGDIPGLVKVILKFLNTGSGSGSQNSK